MTGTGPRLQVLSGDAEVNRRIESEFAGWAKAVGLAEKLRTMRVARAQDGEAFGLMLTNEDMDSPVKLDLRLVEADQVASPAVASAKAGTPSAVDGIVLDEFGNPAVLRSPWIPVLEAPNTLRIRL